MRICMVTYDMQEFGGLEEYAVALAISLQQAGHPVSFLSTAWISPDNQYLQRLNKNRVMVIQPPRWLSLPASDWQTKEKILSSVIRLAAPIVYLLAVGLFLIKRKSWEHALVSARGWLNGLILHKIIEPDRRKPFVRLLLNWWRLRWKPDLLHLHGYTTNLLFVIDWAHEHKLPVVYEEHQTPDDRFDWWKDFQSSINQANVVIAVSEKSADALKTVCGVTRPIVVRSPLLADPYEEGWEKIEANSQSSRILNITTIARLYETKGLNFLLDAIPQVQKLHPNVQFVVYGDGPLRQALFEYAEKLGLKGSQLFVGAFTQMDLPKILSKTDIFVMPSILEGQPLALVEAMAYGCPIVATSVGGIPELIINGKNGLLCEPGDPICLAQNIVCLLEDKSLRLSLGNAARRSYEHGPFQPAAVRDHFVSIYSSVISGNSFTHP